MRIIEDTPERLTLEFRPWVLGSVLIAVILLMVGVGWANLPTDPALAVGMLVGVLIIGLVFVALVRRVLVIFDREAQAVVLRSRSLLRQSETTLPLSEIRQASVETHIRRSSRSRARRAALNRTHRPVLETRTGRVPLTQIYSGGTGAAEIVTAVNAWLGVPSRTGATA